MSGKRAPKLPRAVAATALALLTPALPATAHASSGATAAPATLVAPAAFPGELSAPAVRRAALAATALPAELPSAALQAAPRSIGPLPIDLPAEPPPTALPAESPPAEPPLPSGRRADPATALPAEPPPATLPADSLLPEPPPAESLLAEPPLPSGRRADPATALPAELPSAAAFPAEPPPAPGPQPPPAPATAPAPAPGLTVTVLGGGTPTDERAAIDYTIELRNDGSRPYRHLAVSALLPAGFHLVQASPRPGSAAAVPTWTADVAPGQRVDIQARVAAGTLQDLADGTPAPLADAPAALVDASVPGAQAWYSVSACVRPAPADPPMTCGLSSQLLVKTADDTRSGVDAMVLLLGLPAVVALFGAYAWRARRDPGES